MNKIIIRQLQPSEPKKPIDMYIGIPCAICGKYIRVGDVTNKAEIPTVEKGLDPSEVEVHIGCARNIMEAQ
jgi:hypothetical protein